VTGTSNIATVAVGTTDKCRNVFTIVYHHTMTSSPKWRLVNIFGSYEQWRREGLWRLPGVN